MKQKKCKPLLAALLTLVVLLVAVVLIWLAEVRPNAGKGRSEIITDFLRAELIHDGETATQEFTYDKDILTIGLEFYLPGEQPSGTLDVVLRDADTGEELSQSEGVMDYIVPDQYTTLGMDPAVTGQEGRRYRLEVTPHYATDAILAIGHSDGVALWREQMTVGDRVIDGTMAMQITYQRIGGYLTRFFLIVGGLAAVLAAFAVWAVLSGKIALHRFVFALVLGFGLLYCFILPPYAAPDEKYHINQSFTMACHWANSLSAMNGGWARRPSPSASAAWAMKTPICRTRTPRSLRGRPLPRSCSPPPMSPLTAIRSITSCRPTRTHCSIWQAQRGVFLAYLLHLGFAPALLLGRLANLLLFAALAALAVRVAPFGKRVFAVAALLPMTLHLAASFSRDAPLLGLCFAFTALLMDAAFDSGKAQGPLPARLAALLLCGVLLAPGSWFICRWRRCCWWCPAHGWGTTPRQKKCAYLAACLLLALSLNTSLVTDILHKGQIAEGVTSEKTETADENTLKKLRKTVILLRGEQSEPIVGRGGLLGAGPAGGDVSPATLGQSFIFSPEKAGSYTDAQAFFTMASYALFSTDVTAGNADAYLPYFTRAAPTKHTKCFIICLPVRNSLRCWD